MKKGTEKKILEMVLYDYLSIELLSIAAHFFIVKFRKLLRIGWRITNFLPLFFRWRPWTFFIRIPHYTNS